MSTRIVRLERFCDSCMGTFGTLSVGARWWKTVEPPWLHNQPGVSCIPAGTYPMELGRFNKGGYPAWEVLDVPGRSEIKIHRANCASQLLGCIAPGLSLGWVKVRDADEPTWAVTNSRKAFQQFMHVMNEDYRLDDVVLDVRWKNQ